MSKLLPVSLALVMLSAILLSACSSATATTSLAVPFDGEKYIGFTDVNGIQYAVKRADIETLGIAGVMPAGWALAELPVGMAGGITIFSVVGGSVIPLAGSALVISIVGQTEPGVSLLSILGNLARMPQTVAEGSNSVTILPHGDGTWDVVIYNPQGAVIKRYPAKPISLESQRELTHVAVDIAQAEADANADSNNPVFGPGDLLPDPRRNSDPEKTEPGCGDKIKEYIALTLIYESAGLASTNRPLMHVYGRKWQLKDDPCIASRANELTYNQLVQKMFGGNPERAEHMWQQWQKANIPDSFNLKEIQGTIVEAISGWSSW